MFTDRLNDMFISHAKGNVKKRQVTQDVFYLEAVESIVVICFAVPSNRIIDGI